MRRIFLFAVLFLMAGTAGAQLQRVPDRQISIFTNQYSAAFPLLIGDTLRSAFSNLEPRVSQLITNKVGEVGSNLFLTATETNIFYPAGNPSNFIPSNVVVTLLGGYYPIGNPSNYITLADIPPDTTTAAVVQYDHGHIHGLVPTYLSSTSLSVTAGSIVVGGTNFFRNTAATTLQLSALLGTIVARDIVYVYVDTSSSSSNSIVFYGSTNEPTENTSGGHDAHPVATEDVHIGSARVASAGGALLAFHTTGRGDRYRYRLTGLTSQTDNASAELLAFQKLSVFTNMTAMNVVGSGVNDLVPVGACAVHVSAYTEHATAFGTVAVRTIGSTASGAAAGGSLYVGAVIYQEEEGHNRIPFDAWVPVERNKATRNIFIGADGWEPDQTWAILDEWEIQR